MMTGINQYNSTPGSECSSIHCDEKPRGEDAEGPSTHTNHLEYKMIKCYREIPDIERN
jgi:hypothetical protein